jgi:hypothetical protein
MLKHRCFAVHTEFLMHMCDQHAAVCVEVCMYVHVFIMWTHCDVCIVCTEQRRTYKLLLVYPHECRTLQLVWHVFHGIRMSLATATCSELLVVFVRQRAQRLPVHAAMNACYRARSHWRPATVIPILRHTVSSFACICTERLVTDIADIEIAEPTVDFV